jgi:hypothetical protein
MDKGCKNCKHYEVTNSLERDHCALFPLEFRQKELTEFLFRSPLERELIRLTECLGIKSCKYFEPKR